jgi:hypothetical protein
MVEVLAGLVLGLTIALVKGLLREKALRSELRSLQVKVRVLEWQSASQRWAKAKPRRSVSPKVKG